MFFFILAKRQTYVLIGIIIQIHFQKYSSNCSAGLTEPEPENGLLFTHPPSPLHALHSPEIHLYMQKVLPLALPRGTQNATIALSQKRVCQFILCLLTVINFYEKNIIIIYLIPRHHNAKWWRASLPVSLL